MRPKRPYIALEELNYFWDEEDLPIIDRMWNEGRSLWDIADRFHRDPDEVVLLIMDRRRQGLINNRPGGSLGHCSYS
ncbi:helix-turn-helix domain containing protein [Paenibacillus sp. KR2-11]|uniref:helix-turn-helix domain containing protein n=1 Tax=Paenibacillus sp. KR2-11 TaxID=3385500 RepID=UPI0038FCC409